MSVQTAGKPVRYCGRLFTSEEMEWIRRLMASEPLLNRAQLSRRVCSELRWVRPDGQSKEMSCRFLVLPWVTVANLASRILAASAKRLPRDWENRYGYRPRLLETFVERDRFRGTCYRAANWIYVGETQGRGKLDCNHRHALPVKHVYLYPLHRRFRQQLHDAVRSQLARVH
jgi:hypothetical protein